MILEKLIRKGIRRIDDEYFCVYMRVDSNRHNYIGSWSVIMYVA